MAQNQRKSTFGEVWGEMSAGLDATPGHTTFMETNFQTYTNIFQGDTVDFTEGCEF